MDDNKEHVKITSSSYLSHERSASAFPSYDIFRLLTFLQIFLELRKKLMLALELSTYEKEIRGNLMQFMSSKSLS